MQEFAYTQKHMGTDISVSVVTLSESLAKTVAEEAFEVIADYEQRFSRFLPTSELSQLNSSGDLIVSEGFFEVFTRSYELYLKTGKAFNPLLQIARQGYDANYSDISDAPRTTVNDSYNTDFTKIKRNETTKRVVLQPGQKLDFGGVLKGYLATKLSKELKNKHPDCAGLIVNIGGDLHTIGHDEHDKPFIFNLYNPVTKEELPIPLTNTSLVTSGTYKRTWNTSTGPRHHILAPDGINNPNTDILSVSIIHEDGATAEAYATLFIVRDLTEVQKIINVNNFNYFIVKNDGTTLTNII